MCELIAVVMFVFWRIFSRDTLWPIHNKTDGVLVRPVLVLLLVSALVPLLVPILAVKSRASCHNGATQGLA